MVKTSNNMTIIQQINNITDGEKRLNFLSKKNQEGELVNVAKIIFNEDDVSLKYEYFLSLVNLIEKEDLVKQIHVELCGALDNYIPKTDNIPDLAEFFIKQLKSGSVKSLELFGTILRTVYESSDSFSIDNELFTGPEYKSYLVNKICNVRWSRDTVMKLAGSFQDLKLNSKETSFVVDKITSSMEIVDVSSIPQLVHSLLLFAAKGHHKKVVVGLIEYFNKKKIVDPNDLLRDEESDFTQAEGTSLLHISFAVKHDLELGRAIAQQVKTQNNLSVFLFGLGISLLQHDRFSDTLSTTLKSLISQSLKSRKLWTQSSFIREALEEEAAPESTLKAVLKKTITGWDHITEGLVKLGFILLGTPGDETKTGFCILEECFKLHLNCRREVITQLINTVVTSSPLNPNTLYHKLLVKLASRSVQLLLSLSSKLKDSMSNVPLIPLANAKCYLTAIIPVMRYDSSLRDTAILIFRKSLFCKNPDSRRIAVFGLTEMMRKFKVGENYSQSSQLSCSQVQVHLMVTDDINEAVCTEILLLLRRGLSQQGSVRCDIYGRLGDILASNHQLHPLLLQLLEEQLQQVTEPDPGVLPPVLLARCLNTAPEVTTLQEPVMALYRAAFTCRDLLHSRAPGDVDRLTDTLNSVVLRSSKCDLEDWDLEKGAEYSLSGPGSRNSVTALAIISLYEVLLDSIIVDSKGSAEKAELFKKTFRLMYSAVTLLSDKQTNRGKRARVTERYFSMDAGCVLLNYLVLDEMVEHEQCIAVLKTITDLYTWLISTLSEHVKQIAAREMERNEVYTLGLLTKCLIARLSNKDSLYREQTSALLEKCISAVLSSDDRDLIPYYCDVVTDSCDLEVLSQQITSLFNQSVEEEDFGEASSHIAIIDKLHETHDDQSKLSITLEPLLNNDKITSTLARDVLTVILSCYRNLHDKLELHTAIARDVLATLGDIEVEDEDSMVDDIQHRIVNENSAERLLAVILNSISTILSDIEWGLQHSRHSDDTSELHCQYLSKVASVLSECLVCKLAHESPATDNLAKTIKKFYNSFTLVVKQESAKSQGGLLKALENLSKFVGRTLHQKLYSFLIYLEQPAVTGVANNRNPKAAKIRRQAVSVPGIIYSVELCEKHLIILSKKTRTDLMEHFKRSPARDFKVDVAVLEEKLVSNKVDETTINDESSTEKPSRKKKKTK